MEEEITKPVADVRIEKTPNQLENEENLLESQQKKKGTDDQ